MRASRACRECRISKRRCTRRGPGEACAPCRQRGVTCDSDIGHHRERHKLARSGAAPSLQPQEQPPATDLGNLSKETIMSLAAAYLEKVHDRMHTILHPPTFRMQLLNDKVPRALLCAVCALGSKFSPNPEHRHLEEALTSKAKSLLQLDLENMCVENVQTCILVSVLCGGNGQSSSEGLFIRIGISMAEIMNLESIATHEPCITTRETANMVCWSLFLANHRCFSGLGLPRSFEDSRVKCDLPVDEVFFHSLKPDQMDAGESPKPGLWAQMMELVWIAGAVVEHNRRIARCEIKPEDLAAAVRHLEERLEKWVDALPADAQMTTQNLHRQQRKGFGGLFIALHLTFYCHSTLLYFGFLERREATSWECRTSISRCKHYATSFSGLLHLSRQLEGCRISYPVIGHMINVSSSVLVHTLLFGDPGEIKDAREELNSNFEALTELQQHWPATSAMINRLMKFQETCLLSAESHRLDGWMVKFLLEYSVVLEDRQPSSDTVSASIDVTRGLARAMELKEPGRYTDFEDLQRRSDERRMIDGVGG